MKMSGKMKAQAMTSRRSTTESVKTEDDEEIIEGQGMSPSRRTKLSQPSSQLKGEVCGDHCLVCNDRCFIRPFAENLTEPESKLSYDLREMFYEVYQIPCDEEYLQTKSIKSEFPLCYSCSYHLGQLKGLWERLKELHRDFVKFQETVAFSIVDVVAGAVPKRPLLDFEKLKPETLNVLLMKSERSTLQNFIYNEWHNKVPSFPEYETNSIPTINPIVDAPPISKPKVPGLVLAAPKQNPTIFTRPILSKSTIEKSVNGNSGKTTVISITTKEDTDRKLARTTSSTSIGKRLKLDPNLVAPGAENGNEEEIDDSHAEGNDIDVEYDCYNQEEENPGVGEDGEQYAGEEGDEVFQHFASRGHFLDGNSGDGQWEGEEEYNEYEQLYEDAGFNDTEENGMGSRYRAKFALYKF